MGVRVKVVFSGELKPGADPDAVAVAFSSAFGISEAKAKKLMRVGREVDLKKDLENTVIVLGMVLFFVCRLKL